MDRYNLQNLGPLTAEANEICAKEGYNFKSKHTVQNFAQLKEAFLADVTATVTMKEVPPELIPNCDQTGIKFVTNSS